VSGRADVAAISRLAGVHLPGAGVPAGVARAILGPAGLIGRSTHTLEEVRAAHLEGADYVFFGPVRETQSKRGVAAVGFAALAEAAALGVPVLALGGLDVADFAAVRSAGAHGLAAISAFLPERLAAAGQLVAELSAAEVA
jgi:thiamine-phosphate pyrophosphorylase